LILRKIDEASYGTAEVAEANLHCDTDSALKTAADIVAVPCAN
jgi:hypothetical protein